MTSSSNVTLFIRSSGDGRFLLPKNFWWLMSIVSVIFDRCLNHLDSSAGSKFDSTIAINCADVPKSVDTNPGEMITTGHLALSAVIISSVVVVGGETVDNCVTFSKSLLTIVPTVVDWANVKEMYDTNAATRIRLTVFR